MRHLTNLGNRLAEGFSAPSDGGWSPLMLPGIVGWWQVDATETGLTIAEASVPSNIQADWTATNLASKNDIGGGVYELRDTSDAVAVKHQATASPVNHVAGLITWGVTVVGWGGTGISHMCFAAAGDGLRVIANLTTRAVAPGAGVIATRVTEVPGVGWRFEATGWLATVPSPAMVRLMAGGNGHDYIGDGTGYLRVRDFSVTQRRITAVANRVSGGPALVPLAGASAPKLYNRQLDTWTGEEGFYADEYGALRESATIGAMFAGTNKPVQIYHVCRGRTGTAFGTLYGLSGATARHSVIQNDATQTLLRPTRIDDAATSAAHDAADALPNATLVAQCDYFDGTTRRFHSAGVTTSQDQTLGAQTFERLGWGGGADAAAVVNPCTGNFRALILSTEARTRDDADDLRMRRWLSSMHRVPA